METEATPEKRTAQCADLAYAVCSKCAKQGALAAANKSRITGERLYRTWCKTCEKQRKDVWRLTNAPRHNTNTQTWRDKNKTKTSAIRKKWLDKNKAQAKLAQKNWRRDNAEKVRAQVNVRRRHLRLATPVCLSEFHRFCMAELYHLAQLRSLTVDHIVPIQHTDVCGLHVPWNLQLLSPKENFQKSNTFLGLAPRSKRNTP